MHGGFGRGTVEGVAEDLHGVELEAQHVVVALDIDRWDLGLVGRAERRGVHVGEVALVAEVLGMAERGCRPGGGAAHHPLPTRFVDSVPLGQGRDLVVAQEHPDQAVVLDRTDRREIEAGGDRRVRSARGDQGAPAGAVEAEPVVGALEVTLDGTAARQPGAAVRALVGGHGDDAVGVAPHDERLVEEHRTHRPGVELGRCGDGVPAPGQELALRGREGVAQRAGSGPNRARTEASIAEITPYRITEKPVMSAAAAQS